MVRVNHFRIRNILTEIGNIKECGLSVVLVAIFFLDRHPRSECGDLFPISAIPFPAVSGLQGMMKFSYPCQEFGINRDNFTTGREEDEL